MLIINFKIEECSTCDNIILILFAPNAETRSSSSLTLAPVVGDTAPVTPPPTDVRSLPPTCSGRRTTHYAFWLRPVHGYFNFLTFVFLSLARSLRCYTRKCTNCSLYTSFNWHRNSCFCRSRSFGYSATSVRWPCAQTSDPTLLCPVFAVSRHCQKPLRSECR